MESLDCPIEWNKNTAVEEEELGHGVEKYIEKKRRCNSESESKVTNNLGERNLAADAQFKLGLTEDYPIDRGHCPSTIQDAAPKRRKFSCADLADHWGLIGIEMTMERR